MSNRNQVTGSFATIAQFDAATSNVTGISVGNITATGSNIYFSNISNLHIPGGTANQFIRTDGTGNLSWGFGGVTWNSGFTNSTVQTTQIGSLGNSSVTVQSPLGTAVTDFINSGSVIALGTDTANLYTISTVSSVVLNTATLNFTPQLTQGYANSSFAFLANINQTLGLTPGSNTTFAISNGVITINSLPTGIANGTTIANVDGVNGNLTANSAANITLLAANNVSVTANSTGNLSLLGNNFVTITANTGNLIQTAAGNIHWNARGVGNANVPAMRFNGNDLYITRGGSALTGQSDEFISLGSNTYNSTVVAGLNSANTQYAGMRISRAGTERWFLGADNSSANGNFVLNSPNGTASRTFINSSNIPVTERIASPTLYTSWTGGGSIILQTAVYTGYPLYTSTVGTGAFSSTATEAQIGITNDTSTTNGRFTITRGGIFIISAYGAYPPSTSGSRALLLSYTLPSVTLRPIAVHTTPAVNVPVYGVTLNFCVCVQLPANTQLFFQTMQNTGSNVTLAPDQNQPWYVSFTRV